MKVVNILNYQQEKGEVNYQPSMTVPDEAMSVKEILTRYAKGLPLGGVKTPIYEGEDDFLDGIDPARLDLAERQELKERYTQELEEIREKQRNILKKPEGVKGGEQPPSPAGDEQKQ